MTARELARMECANYREGACQGLIIHDDGTMAHSTSMPKFCNVGEKGVRCRYFEECVLPMGTADMKPLRKRQFEEGVNSYWSAAHPQAVNKPAREQRSCPGCGRLLEPLKRFCYVCAEKRRKEQTRLAVAKSRVRCKQSAPKIENSASDNQGLTNSENGGLGKSISK